MALKTDNQAPPVADWIVTYGDMMSLLLTFFILLFSMSEIRQDRSQALIEALRNQFGYEKSTTSMIPGPSVPLNSAIARLASLGRAQRLNTMNGGDKVKAPVGDHHRVQAIRPGDETTLGGVIEFAEDEGDLSDAAISTIEAAAAVLKGKPQKIEIRGHSSAKPLPPTSPYCNHWDLSYARAFKVYEQLVKCGIQEQRLRISLAAANEPVELSPTGKQPSKNARVEIFMLEELASDLAGTAEERARRYSPDDPGPPGDRQGPAEETVR